MRVRYWRVRFVQVPPYARRRYQTQYSVDHVTWEPSHSYGTLHQASAMIEQRVSNALHSYDEWEPGETWALLTQAERDRLQVMKALRGWTRSEDGQGVYRMVFAGLTLVGWDFLLNVGQEPREEYGGHWTDGL